LLAVPFASRIDAQVQTIVPPVIPSAKPVTTEHIKIHGTSLDGNLEGDAVDRDVIVFPKHRRYPALGAYLLMTFR